MRTKSGRSLAGLAALIVLLVAAGPAGWVILLACSALGDGD